MNFEDFEDDFEPAKGDFIIQEPELEEPAEEKFASSETEEAQNTNNESFEEVVSREETDANDSYVDFEDEEPMPKKKKSKIGIIIKILLILAILSGVIVFLSGNDYFRNYKTNFIMNIYMIDSKYGISDAWEKAFGSKDGDLVKKREESRAMGTTYDNESYMLPFESASDAQYAVVDGCVIAAKSNYLAMLDKKGAELWNVTTSVVNPILAVEGEYVAVAENGGTKVCLYSGGQLVYAVDVENEILNANVSSRGDVVVVTKKDFFKGAVEVLNKQGEHVFSWSSGVYSVMCADISPSGRRIAVGFLDDKEGIKSIVQFFNIDEKESYKTVEIPGSAVFKLEFTGETLNVFANNRLIGLSVHGAIVWDELPDGILCAYDLDSQGNKVVVVDNNNLPVIRTYSKKGNLKDEDTTDELPDYVDIADNILLYNNTRMIYFGKLGREQKYAASMDVKGLRILDKKNYMIIYSNSLEFVKK